jgi:hypothetical protein
MEVSSPQSNGSLLDPLGIEGKIKVPRTPRGSKHSDHGDGSRPMEDEEAQEEAEAAADIRMVAALDACTHLSPVPCFAPSAVVRPVLEIKVGKLDIAPASPFVPAAVQASGAELAKGTSPPLEPLRPSPPAPFLGPRDPLMRDILAAIRSSVRALACAHCNLTFCL